jgi:peptide/nickel transport system substrate-binding protein
MDEGKRRVDEFRKSRSELDNHLIDELVAGKISRREFVRRGTVLGLSLSSSPSSRPRAAGTTTTARPRRPAERTRAAARRSPEARSAPGSSRPRERSTR